MVMQPVILAHTLHWLPWFALATGAIAVMGRPKKDVDRLTVSLPADQVAAIRALAQLTGRDMSYIISSFLEPPVRMCNRIMEMYDGDPLKLDLFRDMLLGESVREPEADLPKS
jgi:hypothetical protein